LISAIETMPVEDVEVRTQPTAPDGGYGWVVLLASFISFFIADGVSYSFGVLFPEIVDYFEESRGATSIVGTLLYAIPMIVSPLACALVSTFGYRIVGVIGGLVTGLSLASAVFATSISGLCVIIGLMAGMGLAMVYVSAFFAVTVYFKRRRGLATSIAVAGSGIGALSFPPMIERLLEEYAWRGTILITGGICLNLALVGSLYRPLQQNLLKPECEKRTVKKYYSHCQTYCCQSLAPELRKMFSLMFSWAIFSSVPFLMFCFANFGLYLWISIPYIYIVDYALLKNNILSWQASLLLSISGFGRILGQFIFGVLGDLPSVSPTLLFACGILMTGLFTLLVPVLASSYSVMGVYAAAFGASASVTYVLPMICLVELLGLDHAVNAFGFLQLVQGVATLLGTPTAGEY